MNQMNSFDGYAHLIQPATLRIERLLPGTRERVWEYLTQSDLRCKWLAAGDMEMEEGSSFELVWRNDELTDPPGDRPASFSGGEQRMHNQIVECDPPRKLTITWNGSGNVTFELAQRGDDVLLTLVHRRLPDRSSLMMHAAGWHVHLDLLVARVAAEKPEPFWDSFSRIVAEYDRRLPA
ncbi:SRPBCC family protein [Mesorhizobium sp. M0006]|uniref:SRPBCC family protein n=1 Tax=unclassified Mesorhizobium TaxID=325217 RepID=UPI003335850C